MSSRVLLLAFALAAAASPALAKEKVKTPAAEAIVCEGAFAIDSSEARLIEIYGAENVWTGTVPGPEGIEMLATEVFRDDPDRKLQFVWWDEKELKDPSYIELPPTLAAPYGIKAGMSIAEVERINGGPFTLSGFGWDYGGFANIQEGALADMPGDCILSLNFWPADYPVDEDTTSVVGDVEVSSDDPLLEKMGVHVGWVAVGYPHYDFR